MQVVMYEEKSMVKNNLSSKSMVKLFFSDQDFDHGHRSTYSIIIMYVCTLAIYYVYDN